MMKQACLTLIRHLCTWLYTQTPSHTCPGSSQLIRHVHTHTHLYTLITHTCAFATCVRLLIQHQNSYIHHSPEHTKHVSTHITLALITYYVLLHTDIVLHTCARSSHSCTHMKHIWLESENAIVCKGVKWFSLKKNTKNWFHFKLLFKNSQYWNLGQSNIISHVLSFLTIFENT